MRGGILPLIAPIPLTTRLTDINTNRTGKDKVIIIITIALKETQLLVRVLKMIYSNSCFKLEVSQIPIEVVHKDGAGIVLRRILVGNGILEAVETTCIREGMIFHNLVFTAEARIT